MPVLLVEKMTSTSTIKKGEMMTRSWWRRLWRFFWWWPQRTHRQSHGFDQVQLSWKCSWSMAVVYMKKDHDQGPCKQPDGAGSVWLGLDQVGTVGLGHDEQDRSTETSRRAGLIVKTFDVMLIIFAGGSPVLVGLHGLRVSRQRCSSALPWTGRILISSQGL